MPPKAPHPEAHRALSGVLALGSGQVLVGLAGLFSAVLVPRLLGASDYGQWVIYRGLITMLSAWCLLGDYFVMSAFYVPRRAAGDAVGAGQVYKSFVLLRLGVSIVAAGAGYVLLRHSNSLFARPGAAIWLGASVVAGASAISMLTLIHAERRMVGVAVISVLQAVSGPAAVLAARATLGLTAVPAFCAAADGTVFLVALALARPFHAWAPGWPDRGEWLRWLRYALSLVAATSVMASLLQALPYLMRVRGYAPAAVGRVGLAVRCGLFLFAALSAAASGLLPNFAILLERAEPERTRGWQDLLTRVGTAVFMATLLGVLLAAPVLAPRIWGPDYTGLAPLLAAVLVGFLLLWYQSQWIRLHLVAGRVSGFLACAVAYAGAFGLALVLLPPDASGMNAALTFAAACLGAMLAGAVVTGAPGGWALLRHGAGAALLAGAAALWSGRLHGVLASLAAAVAAVLLYAAFALATRFVRWHEILETLTLALRLRRAGAAPADGDPPDSAPLPPGSSHDG